MKYEKQTNKQTKNKLDPKARPSSQEDHPVHVRGSWLGIPFHALGGSHKPPAWYEMKTIFPRRDQLERSNSFGAWGLCRQTLSDLEEPCGYKVSRQRGKAIKC